MLSRIRIFWGFRSIGFQLMADRVIFDIGQVVDKACIYTMEGSMIRVHCQLMICRRHIRASKGALKIFLRLTVVCEN